MDGAGCLRKALNKPLAGGFGDSGGEVQAALSREGDMKLVIDGKTRALGRAPGPLVRVPSDGGPPLPSVSSAQSSSKEVKTTGSLAVPLQTSSPGLSGFLLCT